jgi:serpin B
MFRTINKSEDGNKNVFISPLSISLALAMTTNGANGDTRTEMQNTLQFPDYAMEDINGYFQTLSNTLLSLDPEVKLGIANSIWYRLGFSVLPDFLSMNESYYNAEVQELDFSDPGAVNTINGWCATKTNDKIKKVLDQIGPDVVMYLINAIYFKGMWTYDFDKDLTAEGAFNNQGAGQSTVSFMHQEGAFRYYYNDSLQLLEMTYGQGNFSMVVMLPAAGTSVAALADGLTPEIWNGWLADTFKTKVEIALPRFKFEYERVLNDDLIGLGMVKAFGPADFSNINPDADLCISMVKHNSFVEVNEEGTEAAAVTVVEIIETSAPPESVQFIVDRPFLFAIRETTTNTILFLGKVSTL